MIKLGNLSYSFLRLLMLSYQQAGGNPGLRLEHFGIDQQLLEQVEQRLSFTKYMRLCHTAMSAVDDFSLGLYAGQHIHPGDFGLAGFAAHTAPNLTVSAHCLAQYEPLSRTNCRGQSRLRNDTQNHLGLRLQFYSIAPYNHFNRFVVDSILSAWYHLLNQTYQQKVVTEVHVEFEPPDYVEHYRQVFDCPVYFAKPVSALVLHHNSDLINPHYHSPSFRYFQQACDQALEQAEKTLDFKQRVQGAIAAQLTSPTLESVAEELAIPTWTLKRRLKEEQTSYSTLLETTRQSLARSYVKETELAFSEVAYLLGFSSPTAFQRAFKRWFKVTPGQYRQQINNR